MTREEGLRLTWCTPCHVPPQQGGTSRAAALAAPRNRRNRNDRRKEDGGGEGEEPDALAVRVRRGVSGPCCCW